MKSDAIIYQGIFPSRGYNGLWMCCDLLIEKISIEKISGEKISSEKTNSDKGSIYLITFTEREDNLGTSVTNLSEQLASEVISKFGLDPSGCEFFEKYTYPDKADRLDRINYLFERVGDCWVATSARWQYIAG